MYEGEEESGRSLMEVMGLTEEDTQRLAEWEEDAVTQILQDFAKPREPRTMGRIPVDVWHMAVLVSSRNRFMRSRVRDHMIETLLFMSRSVGGWGSEQYASVVKSRKRSVNEKLKRFFMGDMGDENGE